MPTIPDLDAFPFAFPSVRGKKLTAAFEGGRLTSDGGILRLAQAAQRLGIAEKLAAVIPDRRDPGRVLYPLSEILLARIPSIAGGYEDADDSTTCVPIPRSGSPADACPRAARI